VKLKLNKILFLLILFLFTCAYSLNIQKAHVEHYTVYADTHYYAPYESKIELQYNQNVYYIGDIFDLQNCKNKDVNLVIQEINDLRKRVGNRYVRGNHELNAFGDADKLEDYFTTINGVLFTHGHKYICYDDAKVKNWEQKNPGKNSILRVLRKIKNVFEKEKDRLDGRYIDNAVDLATKNNCHTIVFGHTHLKKMYDKIILNSYGQKIRVINVPRGISEIYIEIKKENE